MDNVGTGPDVVDAKGASTTTDQNVKLSMKSDEILDLEEQGIIDLPYRLDGNKKKRIGSRKIRILQVKKANMLPKDPNARQIRDEVVKKIGSQWKAKTKDIIRGLNKEEEIEYLPDILGMKPTDLGWQNKVREFWLNFNIQVIAKEGYELEAGFKVGPNGEEAVPIDVTGWMEYNFALANSNVADEFNDNPIYDFRLIDTEEQAVRDETAFTYKRKVDMAYYRLLNAVEKDPSEVRKLDMILETIGGEYGQGMNLYGLSLTKKGMELGKTKDKFPKKFIDALDDRDLEIKALLRKAILYGKVRVEGNAFFYNGIVLGNSEGATIGWLKDPNNSAELMYIREAVKEYQR